MCKAFKNSSQKFKNVLGFKRLFKASKNCSMKLKNVYDSKKCSRHSKNVLAVKIVHGFKNVRCIQEVLGSKMF